MEEFVIVEVEHYLEVHQDNGGTQTKYPVSQL